MTKEEQARAVLADALVGRKAPAILCSFGKDSLVVLDLATQLGAQTVLHAHGPDEQVDPGYVHALSRRYGLTVRVLPKGRGHLFFIGHKPLLLSFIAVTPGVLLPFPTTLAPYEGTGWFDCMDDELRARHGTISPTPVDLLISGQKAGDVEHTTCEIVQRYLPHEDRVALRHQAGAHTSWGTLPICCPLHDWSDADVWEYIDSHDLPVSPRMYDGHHRIHASRPTCTRCHEPFGPALVQCPREGAPITNLAHFTKDTGLPKLAALGVVSREQASSLEVSHAD